MCGGNAIGSGGADARPYVPAPVNQVFYYSKEPKDPVWVSFAGSREWKKDPGSELRKDPRLQGIRLAQSPKASGSHPSYKWFAHANHFKKMDQRETRRCWLVQNGDTRICLCVFEQEKRASSSSPCSSWQLFSLEPTAVPFHLLLGCVAP